MPGELFSLLQLNPMVVLQTKAGQLGEKPLSAVLQQCTLSSHHLLNFFTTTA